MYRKSFTDKRVGDFALNTDIRAESLKKLWTTSERISRQDKLRNDVDIYLHRTPTHVPYIHVKKLRKRAVSYVY